MPYGIQVERFRNPGPNVTVALDGDDTSAGRAAHRRHALVRRLREPVRQRARRRRDGRGRPRSTSGPGTSSRRAGTTGSSRRSSTANGSPCRSSTTPAPSVTIERRPARQQHRGQRPHRNLRRRVLRRRAGVRAPTRPQLPAGTTDVQFRYSTDAAYLDTGWFVDDVHGQRRAGDRVFGRGRVVRDDRHPGQQLDAAGRRELRPHARASTPRSRSRTARATSSTGSTGDADHRRAGSTPSARTATTATSSTLVSNLPTGDLTVPRRGLRAVGHE